MYFYSISTGKYNHYLEVILYSETVHNNKQFAHDYNRVVGSGIQKLEEVASKMCEIGDYHIMNRKFEINSIEIDGLCYKAHSKEVTNDVAYVYGLKKHK